MADWGALKSEVAEGGETPLDPEPLSVPKRAEGAGSKRAKING